MGPGVMLVVCSSVLGLVVDGAQGVAMPPRGGGFAARMERVARGLRRRKRDENESVKSAFGRGVGFYIGEPCEATCNSILFHVYCNKTSGRCECHHRYPVNIDNKICVRAAHLGDSCEYDNACAFFDEHAACAEGTCACSDGFMTAHHSKGPPLCLPGKILSGTVTFLENNYLMTTVSAVAGLIVFTAVLCFVLRLFSKARFNRPGDRMASAGSPPTMLSAFTGGGSHLESASRRASSSLASSTDYLPPSRSYSHHPASSMGSRRPSSASVRSGLSFRTASSFRGYRCREPRRGAPPSPADSSRPSSPPCRTHHHHHHPVHHNSPVDEDDIMDDSPVPTVNVNHLSNHI